MAFAKLGRELVFGERGFRERNRDELGCWGFLRFWELNLKFFFSILFILFIYLLLFYFKKFNAVVGVPVAIPWFL